MSILSRRSMLGIGLALLGGAPVHAATAGSALDLRYAVDMTGLRIADLELAITSGSGTAQTRFMMRSQGLASWFSDAWSRLTATSRIAADGVVRPQRFDAYHYKSDRVREIGIAYDAAGGISRLDVKSQGRSRQSEVPEAMRRGTLDPLSAFLELRAWVGRAAAGTGPKTIRIPVFDGRKRFDLAATYMGLIQAAPTPAHELAISLRGLSGFDADDRLFMPNPDGSGSLRALVSADARLVPVSITSTGSMPGPTVRLVRDCGERCGPA